jgi:hypothetical protein
MTAVISADPEWTALLVPGSRAPSHGITGAGHPGTRIFQRVQYLGRAAAGPWVAGVTGSRNIPCPMYLERGCPRGPIFSRERDGWQRPRTFLPSARFSRPRSWERLFGQSIVIEVQIHEFRLEAPPYQGAGKRVAGRKGEPEAAPSGRRARETALDTVDILACRTGRQRRGGGR